jgi:hypothetical protein
VPENASERFSGKQVMRLPVKPLRRITINQ